MTTAPIIRITHDGSQRTTGLGDVRITGLEDLPEIDIDAVIEAHFPGIVVQKNLIDAITLWLLEHGTVSDADEAAILALANALLVGQARPPALPTTQNDYGPVAYPTGLARFPNSNPTPNGWSIVDDDKVVTGLKP